MKYQVRKTVRFIWRLARNAVCAVPGGTALLFPPAQLAERFGRGDASYAWAVYRHHADQLTRAGFTNATAILEVGCGRNIGTGLLWWARAITEGHLDAVVMLWDVHANAGPESPARWPDCAKALLDVADEANTGAPADCAALREVLVAVACGKLVPAIAYRVCELDQLAKGGGARAYSLVYSHAALEHVGNIQECWAMISRLTDRGGWHSHRIDLADHGRRNENYLEMLEWSPAAWWLTMRFIPGAINRWRAYEYLDEVQRCGLRTVAEVREKRKALPVPIERLARRYRNLEEAELRTTALDVVAQRI